MTDQPNPMVPSIDWGAAAQRFGERMQSDHQVILCAYCVMDLGLTTPPSQVVIWEGKSVCLDHLSNMQKR